MNRLRGGIDHVDRAMRLIHHVDLLACGIEGYALGIDQSAALVRGRTLGRRGQAKPGERGGTARREKNAARGDRTFPRRKDMRQFTLDHS